MPSKSSARMSLLAALNDEITALTANAVRSTAIVTGQTKDFAQASGSAWLYDATHLVTNYHVVTDLVEPVWVRMASRHEHTAKVVGHDQQADLAVLEVPEQDVPALVVRHSPARLGELCFALGSPLGEFPDSASMGIVSGVRRVFRAPGHHAIFDVIQTDCAINFGNSGGPLISVDGEVIGVNCGGIANADGIGFAIPAETVGDIIPELVEHGHIERASLGINVASAIGADDNDRGLVVTAVRSAPAGPFKVGDVLLKVGPHDVQEQQDLLRILRRDLVNRNVPVLVLRDGRQLEIEACPAKAPQT